jgi:uncharacterized protein (DUF1330 family)
MPAYVIAIMEQQHDEAALREYQRRAGKARRAEMVPLAAYGKFEVLEGSPIEGAVILQFPSMAEAKAWYESPAYQEAKEFRLKGGRYRMLLVDGLG